ncbi:AAA family ATPase, partial [Parabacteroides distasonis]
MKEIRLENFRCYTELSIPLKSRVNLLVGDNATGKTSVLRACKFV